MFTPFALNLLYFKLLFTTIVIECTNVSFFSHAIDARYSETDCEGERSVRLSLSYTRSSWMFSPCLFQRVKKARDLQPHSPINIPGQISHQQGQERERLRESQGKKGGEKENESEQTHFTCCVLLTKNGNVEHIMQADWFHTNHVKGKFNQRMKIMSSFTHIMHLKPVWLLRWSTKQGILKNVFDRLSQNSIGTQFGWPIPLSLSDITHTDQSRSAHNKISLVWNSSHSYIKHQINPDFRFQKAEQNDLIMAMYT